MLIRVFLQQLGKLSGKNYSHRDRDQQHSHWQLYNKKPYLTLYLSTPIPHKMASKHASRALRASLRQASAPRVQQRTFVSAVNAASRPTVQRVAPAPFVQQARGAKTVDFAGDKEKVFGKVLLLQ